MSRILPEEVFHAALDEERALAARGGYPACLLVFDVGECGSRGADRRALGEVVGRSLREIDVVGWFGDKQIGVILPGTAPDSAHGVAERLAIEAFPAAPEASVRAFPSSPPDAGALVGPRTARERRPERGLRSRVHCDPQGVIGLLAQPLPRWKRALDVVLASTGLVLLSPLLLVLASAVKATSPGGVIYRQRRTGHHLEPFWIYKFRTMRSGSDREIGALQDVNEMSGPLFKIAADPRLTPIGSFLRRASLDELPQLVNVLRGDMTLLGPRALSPPPSAYEPWQLRRFLTRPGVACEWQATRRAETDFEEWMRSDLRYVDAGANPLTDLRLLVRTIVAVLSGAGGR